VGVKVSIELYAGKILHMSKMRCVVGVWVSDIGGGGRCCNGIANGWD
jgi:hypothetical protein